MPHFIFIHGKNAELSIAELVALTGSRPVEANAEFSIFDLFEAKDMMSRLGGTLKIAEAFSILDVDAGREAIESAIEKHFNELVWRTKNNKLMFGVSLYGGSGDKELLERKIKALAKNEGMKVSAAHAKTGRLTHTDVVNKKILSSGFEVMICKGKRKLYVAKTISVHNPFEFRKRDLDRPAQRSIYSIPPRLARIMINLTCVRRGELLMDPFCGIGTILGEAVLMGMNIQGVDMKDNCIGDTRKNLYWLGQQYKIAMPDMENKVRKEDARWLSSHFRENSVDAIVTEPFMGLPLKRRPDRIRAMNILDDLKPLYEHSLREMLKVLKRGRRICMVSPSFIVGGKFYGLNITEMAGKNGGRVINPLATSGIAFQIPLRDFEDRHNTIREINIIEKIH